MKSRVKCSKMEIAVVLTLTVLCAVQALDCGIHMSRNDELKTVINKCVNSNKTLEDLWDMAPMSSESDSSSSEEEPAVDGKMMQSFRTRRAVIKTPETKIASLPEQQESNSTDSEQDSNQSEESVTENCIIQCIFDNLKMTDSTGYPVHSRILDGLLKNATNREVRDFLQDTTNECFQDMDKEVTMDPCNYSTKLVTCLAEKGKTNCADWPVGDLPFHQ